MMFNRIVVWSFETLVEGTNINSNISWMEWQGKVKIVTYLGQYLVMGEPAIEQVWL